MRNIEKLRNYFLGKDPQLKETMADNSLRLIGIEGKHFVLRTELLKRLQELRKHVDDTDEHLQDEIDDLIRDIASEENNRINADTTLQGNIDALEGRVDGAEDDIDNLQDDMSNVYTKSEVNTITSMLQGKLTAGNNITISDENEISATDTTYDNFVGTTGIDNGQAGLVPAPQSADMGKYLKADGTWASVNDTVFQELTSPVRIWDLSEGTYKLPASCTVYYYGATNTTNNFTTGGPSYLFITADTYNGDACKYYTCFFGFSANSTVVRSGGVKETTGTSKVFSFNLNYETTGFKVTSLSNASTDTEYPSAKCVYDFTNGKVNGNNFITDVWKGTQAAYDALGTYSPTTLYIIE